MRFTTQVGGHIAEVASDAIVLGVFEDGELPPAAQRADVALDGAIAALRTRKEFKAKVGETAGILTFGRLPASRVVLVGLGKVEAFTVETARRAAGSATK